MRALLLLASIVVMSKAAHAQRVAPSVVTAPDPAPEPVEHDVLPLVPRLLLETGGGLAATAITMGLAAGFSSAVDEPACGECVYDIDVARGTWAALFFVLTAPVTVSAGVYLGGVAAGNAGRYNHAVAGAGIGIGAAIAVTLVPVMLEDTDAALATAIVAGASLPMIFSIIMYEISGTRVRRKHAALTPIASVTGDGARIDLIGIF